MPPIPYERLVEVLKKELTEDKKKQPGKIAGPSARSPLAPQRSGNGIRKTSPLLKKDSPREKPIALLGLEKKTPEGTKTVTASPVRPRSAGSPKISPSLKRGRSPLKPEPKPLPELETPVDKPGIVSQASLAPLRSNENRKSPSSRQENQEIPGALKRSKRKSKPDTEGQPQNATQLSQRHPVMPQEIRKNARRSWPHYCRGKGPRGLCRYICPKLHGLC